LTPRYHETKTEQADDLSLMFKKWSINQSIAKERRLLENNNKNYENSMGNREIKAILKS
jgi:intein/homing endonuclease